MRLVIISNMAHYVRSDGVIVGHGATARELGVLAQLFDQVRHVACLHDEPAPATALPYAADNVELVPVPPAGGSDLRAKLGIVGHMPGYALTIQRELRDADAVHVRCPANISALAVAILSARREPRSRWIKYAGNWRPEGAEPASYMLQRRWLELPYHQAQVSINGAWAAQPAHVHTLANPCLTDAELRRGLAAAGAKRLTTPLQLVFVGHINAAKGARIAIDTVSELHAAGVDARLDLAGDGEELDVLRTRVATSALAPYVTLHGALSREALDVLYDRAHFVVLPSRTEGWPKVLSEGMASGAVPIATAVGSIPTVLQQSGTGRALPVPPTASSFAQAIREYADDPARWRREVESGLIAARASTYSAYLDAVRGLLQL